MGQSPPPGPDGPGGRRFTDIELTEEFDANQDGRLDRPERDAAREASTERKQQDRRSRRPGPPGRPGELEQKPRPQDRADALRLTEEAVQIHKGKSLYDQTILRTLFFEFDDTDWHEELVAFHSTDVEVPARLRIDGEFVGEVGVSYRGNTSFDHPEKKSFGVSIDAYQDDLRIDGYKTLNLLNANGDDSLMREVLFSNIASDYMPAPKANFVQVVVNGIYLGVYGNVQQINKEFTKQAYGSRKGVRWKVPPDFNGGGALIDLGDDLSAYKSAYELKTDSADDQDWIALRSFCKVLGTTPQEQLIEVLPQHLDVEETIRFLALDNIFMDSDGYYSRGSDYYVYMDPDQRFHFIHYDNNETFDARRGPRRGGPGGPGGPGRADRFRGPGGGPPGGVGGPPGRGGPPPEEWKRQEEIRQRPGLDRPRRGDDPDRRRDRERRGRGGPDRRGGPGGSEVGPTQPPLFLADDGENRPLITRILSVPQWRERYLEVYRQIVEEQLAQERFARRVEAYRTLLEDSIAKDPMGPSPEAFQSSAIEGEQSLGAIVERRRSFLLKHESLQTHQNEENQDE
jgi:spore coat protein CotH